MVPAAKAALNVNEVVFVCNHKASIDYLSSLVPWLPVLGSYHHHTTSGQHTTCCFVSPADIEVFNVHGEDQGLQIWCCFQLSEEGLLYFFLTRQSVTGTHHNAAHVGCMLILSCKDSPIFHLSQGRTPYKEVKSLGPGLIFLMSSLPILCSTVVEWASQLHFYEPSEALNCGRPLTLRVYLPCVVSCCTDTSGT